ncbi:hypothetical protein tb265_09170 [Gemmatimonadetes bacterium T265]|nr:hypothetical protein tb265_09170 [Gemmatimonadetes bacterium T265]
MKHLVARGSTAVLVAAAALTAACSNNDPMAPQAAQAARVPSSATPAPNHYVGGFVTGGGAGAPVAGNPVTGPTSPTGGYMVTWTKGDQPTPPSGQQ